MTDLPALALILWAAVFWVRAIAEPNGARFAGAALCFFGACCASFQSVLILPAIVLHAWMRGRFDRRFVTSVALPCLAFLGFLGAVYSRYGVFPFVSSNPESGFSMAEEVQRGLGSEGHVAWVFGGKAIHALAILGSCFLVLLPLRAVLAREGLGFVRRLAGGTVVALAALHFFLDAYGPRADYGWGQLVWLAALVTLGGNGLVLALRGSGLEVDRDHGSKLVLLGVWALTVLAFNVVVLPFGAARYHLLAVPPLFLALWNGVPWAAARLHRRAVGIAATGTLLVGLACAYVDYRQAGFYRALAGELRAGHPRAGLWFWGEWGLRHYFLDAGGRYLLRERDDAEVGDIVVRSEMQDRFSWPPAGLSLRVEREGTREIGSVLPIRLFGGGSMAGFWSHGWGLLPWTVSRAPLESVEIYTVARPRAEEEQP